VTGSGYVNRIKYTEKRKRLFFAVNQAKAAFLIGHGLISSDTPSVLQP